MGQSIYSESPGETTMELKCDGADHGLFPAHLKLTGGCYIARRSAATKAGWRRIDGGQWRGPCCAKGKGAADD